MQAPAIAYILWGVGGNSMNRRRTQVAAFLFSAALSLGIAAQGHAQESPFKFQ